LVSVSAPSVSRAALSSCCTSNVTARLRKLNEPRSRVVLVCRSRHSSRVFHSLVKSR
jgi:hypothetical protein